MKSSLRNVLCGTAAFLFGFALSTPSWAFNVTQTLGPSALATDIIQFTCPAGTVSARGIVMDRNPPAAAPLIQLGLFKGALMPVVETVQEGASLPVARPAGPGVYWAIISKSAAGAEMYTVNINCHTATGAILPALGVALTQNQ